MDRKKLEILVVDGSASHIFYMGGALRKVGYLMRSASSAEDALKVMDGTLPALVITDTALSGMTGLDLLRQMKRSARLKDLPVIIHTSEKNPPSEELCMAAGCLAYFKKLADIDVLYRTIEAAVQSVPRQMVRIDTFFRAEVSAVGTVRTEYMTALSEGGLYIKSLTPEPVDALVPVKLFIRGREVSATARVLYSSTTVGGQHREPGMGMKFVDISEQDREYIRNFIREQIAEGLA